MNEAQTVAGSRAAGNAAFRPKWPAAILNDPIRLIVLTFAVKIALGTWLLSLTVTPERPVALLDLLFLATSAVCVTGLSPVDISTALTTAGQGVLLLLIQLGGIGIMSLWLFVLTMGGHLSGRAFRIASSLVGVTSGRRIGRILVSVVAATLIIETIGAALLFIRAVSFSPDLPSAAGWAIFHAVSAFCNAGFSLQSDSLVSFADDGLVTGTIMALIILGGLGYGVLAELVRRDRPFFSLQTQLVLATSLLLIVGSIPFLAALEWCGSSFAGAAAPLRIWNSLFLTVTARTAGFNTIDMGLLRDATLMIVIGLMLVGASPGGTGGGFKTTVLAVLLLRARAIITGNRFVRWRRWELGERLVSQAIWLMLLYLVTAAFLSLALVITETGMPAERNPHRALGLVFEAVSALGTVGLSTGITPHLSPAGRCLLIAAMFIGRIGPLAFFLAIGGKPRRSPVGLIEENVGLG